MLDHELPPDHELPSDFPFTSGQRVRHIPTGQVGVVQGWAWTRSRQRDGSLQGYWVMGVRSGPEGEPERQSALQSMLDGWVADGDAPAIPAPSICPGIDLPCGQPALYEGFCAWHHNARSHERWAQPETNAGEARA